jgi:hypothetical protein
MPSVVSGLRAYALSDSSVAAKRRMIALFAVSELPPSDIPTLISEIDLLGYQHMGIRHVYARHFRSARCSSFGIARLISFHVHADAARTRRMSIE